MLKNIDNNEILSGADAEIWIDNDVLAYAEAASAKYEFKMDEINLVSVFNTGNKPVAAKGTGSLTVYKTNSYVLEKYNDYLTGKKKGIPPIKIMCKETNGYGEVEQKVLYGVIFTDLTLFNVEAATSSKVEMPFVFFKHELIETIK